MKTNIKEEYTTVIDDKQVTKIIYNNGQAVTYGAHQSPATQTHKRRFGIKRS